MRDSSSKVIDLISESERDLIDEVYASITSGKTALNALIT